MKNSSKVIFKIKNFRNLENVEYTVTRGEVNYVIGANESGKTNLLKALRLCSKSRREQNFYTDDNDATLKEHYRLEKFSIEINENGITNQINESLEQINTVNHSENKLIELPRIIYREPRIYSEENWEPNFKLSDVLEKSDEWSATNCLIETFGTDKVKKNIRHLKNKINEENGANKRAMRDELVEELNEKIKSYFEKFKYIDAYPHLSLNRDVFRLIIKSKRKYLVDNNEEKERSAGFKCFFRIILELKSLTSSIEEIFYIIDEPEQNLHPLMIKEFKNEFFNIIESNTNLTLIVATHSSYAMNNQEVDISRKNISFLYRNDDGSVSCKSLSDGKELSEMIIKFYSKHKFNPKDSLSPDTFALTLILDGIHRSGINQHIKRRFKEIQQQLQSGKITRDEFDKQLEEICVLKDVLKK